MVNIFLRLALLSNVQVGLWKNAEYEQKTAEKEELVKNAKTLYEINIFMYIQEHRNTTTFFVSVFMESRELLGAWSQLIF